MKIFSIKRLPTPLESKKTVEIISAQQVMLLGRANVQQQPEIPNDTPPQEMPVTPPQTPTEVPQPDPAPLPTTPDPHARNNVLIFSRRGGFSGAVGIDSGNAGSAIGFCVSQRLVGFPTTVRTRIRVRELGAE
jgi:hypothetical protein